MRGTRFSSGGSNRVWRGEHRFEHWYRDNQVYFITARCRGRVPMFALEAAKAVFWDRFERYTRLHGFVPWVTTVMDNHYHTVGYLRRGDELGEMMRKLHGSVAKLVNDVYENGLGRLVPFWTDRKHHDYFDGCLRDAKQGRLTYRYVRMQAVRAGLVRDPSAYAHTHVNVEMERAMALGAFLEGVRYKRYEDREREGHGH